MHLKTGPDMAAVQEDLRYQANYVKMLIRSGHVQDAMLLIREFEANAQLYKESLPAGIAYLIPFLRGRAYVQQSLPNLARPELETALEIALPDPEATARVRNLLGVVYLELTQPRLALEQHLLCLESIQAHFINDLNFRVNVFRNLAMDYSTLHEPMLAIDIYKEALPILEDLNDIEQQAMVYWGISLAYGQLGDWSQVRLYASRALNIYEANGYPLEAGSLCINLAEALVKDQRFDEARVLLDRANDLLSGTANQALLCYLHKNYADLARHEGNFELAGQHARESISFAQTHFAATQSAEDKESDVLWQDPSHTYAEALLTAALIEEGQGKWDIADNYFEQALAVLAQIGLEETKHLIASSYAKVLEARGDFEKAAAFYRMAAEVQPRLPQRVV
jgi:tetratricopeptide (TPR) repeat protein